MSIGAREYDPATDRFVSADPIIDFGDPQQAHGYAYANNAPATFSDPSCLRHHVDHEGFFWWSNGTEWTGQMQADAQSNKGFWDVMKAELPDLLGDLTGFNDLRACFTKFDLMACAGIIPWARVFKLIKSAGRVFDVDDEVERQGQRPGPQGHGQTEPALAVPDLLTVAGFEVTRHDRETIVSTDHFDAVLYVVAHETRQGKVGLRPRWDELHGGFPTVTHQYWDMLPTAFVSLGNPRSRGTRMGERSP